MNAGLKPQRLLRGVAVLLCSAGLWMMSFAHAGPARVAHVLVALCDNANQGIVKVPAKIGNGQDPKNNLYWGAMYGVRTFMDKQPGFRRVQGAFPVDKPILERIVYRHVKSGAIVLVDAYDGAAMRSTIRDFLDYSAGRRGFDITASGLRFKAGGDAQLLLFVGHNGLMDFSLDVVPAPANKNKRQAAVLACKSRDYFRDRLIRAGAEPLLMTTHFMAPEGYVVHALLAAWAEGRSKEAMHERVAQAYNQYQRCGINGARRLFTVK